MDKNISTRNETIDCLRFVGLSLIILAHVNPPYVLFNLRCFDVPMMLFVSGMAYSNHKIDFSASFFIRRLLRLIVPVYLFLVFYFLLMLGLKYWFFDFGITKQQIVGSFLLRGGIGYVWIIRVFLLVGLLTPILMAKERVVRNDVMLWAFLVGASILMTIAVRMGWGMNNIFVRDYVYYAIGYSIPFVAGLRILYMNLKRFVRFFLLIATFMALLCCLQIYGGGNLLSINAQKYPPQSYFLFYGLFMSFVCYAFSDLSTFSKRMPTICRFIGMNTIWIYLYHIPLVQITGVLLLPWWLRYIFVYLFAVVICYIQVSIVNRLCLQHNRTIYKYLRG